MPKQSIAKSSSRNCVSSPYFLSKSNFKEKEVNSFQPTQCIPVIKHNFESFNTECMLLCKKLLGQLLVRNVNGKRVSGFIVETECYPGNVDVASHSFNNKQTKRNEPMFMDPGTSYVYTIYGMYFCFNVSSKEKGSAVLIRALHPHENLDQMRTFRKAKRKNETELTIKQLCSGPSKLCQALNITKNECNKIELQNSDSLWLEKGVEVPDNEIITTTRIGIKESVAKPYRFYVIGNPSVSVRDRKAEEILRNGS